MHKRKPGSIKRPVQKAAAGCRPAMRVLWESVPRAGAVGIPTPEEFIRFLAGRAQEEEK